MGTKIIMPEMGEGIIEAVVAQWLKQEGDRVEAYKLATQRRTLTI